MRRSKILFVAALLTAVTAQPGIARAAGSDPTAAYRDQQAKANAAAGRLDKAEFALEATRDDMRKLEAKMAENTKQVDALGMQVKRDAVQSYVDGGTSTGFFIPSKDINLEARNRALLADVQNNQVDKLGEYKQAKADLDRTQNDISNALAEKQAQVKDLQDQRAATQKELDRLTVAVKQYEAQKAAERKAAEDAARNRAAAAVSARASRSNTHPAVIVQAPSQGPILNGGDWLCPVAGPHAFGDTWGAARSGGRTHQGTDIMAARNTPVVANVSGTVRQHPNKLGGQSYYLAGDDGNEYYGAHLDHYGASGHVGAGTVIGFVGNSGDASGGATHLHFELHPGGGAAVNPYSLLRAHC